MWLEAVLEELKGSCIQDPVIQFMRQMIFSQLHCRLLKQIQGLPDVRDAVNDAGSATFEHYAAAIIKLPLTLVPSSKAITRHLSLSDDPGSGLSMLFSAPSWRFEVP